MKKPIIFGKLKAFSLAEALIVLLIIAMIVAISTPILTKKKKALNENTSHGKWACKYINGALYSATAKDIDDPLPADSQWTPGCTFPALAKNVKYLWVEVYGGGGGGSRGSVEPWVDEEEGLGFEEPAPRDDEYTLEFSPSNAATGMKWNNKNYYSTSGIFYINPETDPMLYEYCGSKNRFGEVSEDETPTTFASCETYTEESGKCKVTGDVVDDQEQTNCYDPTKVGPGTYCWKYGYSYNKPPATHKTPEELVESCNSYGYNNCRYDAESNKVIYTTYSCINTGYLWDSTGGSSANGLTGTIFLKEGESVFVEKVEDSAKSYDAGTLGGYEHTGASDGDTYKLYHRKASTSGSGVSFSNVLIATMTGGKAGLLTDYLVDGAGLLDCCDNCGSRAGYPNSSQTNTNFCAIDGEDGETTITSAYGDLQESSSVYSDGLSHMNQRFVSYVGCQGGTGKSSANLYPTTRNHNYDFYIGQGGGGQTADGSAKDGERTYFGWITGAGGSGAGDNCRASSSSSSGSTTSSTGLGGSGGGVSTPYGTPQRYYDIPASQDTAPDGRWVIQDGGTGHGGAIIVSW